MLPNTYSYKVFNEIHRVLKPGGRLAVSDLCLKQELPAPLKESIMAYVGCVAGALHVGQYRDMMEKVILFRLSRIILTNLLFSLI